MHSIDLGSDLLNFIVRSEVEPGERLPTISELQDDAHLGISVSKVREQLEVARALGLVDVRSKTGTRLKEYSFAPAVRLSLLYALAQNPGLFQHFSELRNHVEDAFWIEACTLLEDEDRAMLREYVNTALEKLSGNWIRIPNSEHRQFHLTIFKRLDNPFVTGLLEAYWDAYDAVELNSYADYEYLRKVWDYHEKILDAIDVGDFDNARELFKQHTQLLRYQPRMQDMRGENVVKKTQAS
jgi:DNA-binding FadR family transcriptional regulator